MRVSYCQRRAVVYVCCVKIPQAPEDDPHNRQSWARKADISENHIANDVLLCMCAVLRYHRRLRMTLTTVRAGLGRRTYPSIILPTTYCCVCVLC